MTTTVSILGSTGSIGTQAIDVIRCNPEQFRVVALAVNASVDLLVAQAQELQPEVVVVTDERAAQEVQRRLSGSNAGNNKSKSGNSGNNKIGGSSGIEVRCGPEALASIATEADVVLNAVVGFAGLPVTLAALKAGRRLALANKESLVAAGPLVQSVRSTPGADLVPVDSEHAALHQCLRSETPTGTGNLDRVARLVLTASGGPFRGRQTHELAQVTVADALAHPTWQMGRKVTIDSSTLFNKGLEVIEAHELFGIHYDHIEVVVHPQSIVHSAVEFTDGSTIAQLSRPDMRLPIGYALGQPQRMTTPFGALDWSAMGSLTFEAPDRETFRCLDLAYAAGRAGGTAPTWLNAANEVAVEAFLAEKVTWREIASIIEETLDDHDGAPANSLDVVIHSDGEARRRAYRLVERRTPV